jgi:hypothetical protein
MFDPFLSVLMTQRQCIVGTVCVVVISRLVAVAVCARARVCVCVCVRARACVCLRASKLEQWPTSVCNWKYNLVNSFQGASTIQRLNQTQSINCYLYSHVRVILVRFYWNLNFFYGFSKNTQIPNFMKILPVEAELFYADGRTDRHDEDNSHFSQFCERA